MLHFKFKSGQKYEITLNDKKTKLVTFDEINRNSNLKGFFYDLSQKIEVNKILNSNSISNSSNVILYRLIKQLNSFKPDTIKHTLDKFYLTNNLHQEAYATLLLCSKLNFNIITPIFSFIEKAVDKEYVNIDDFNMIFFIHNFILNLDSFSEKDINSFLNLLEKLLKTDKNLYPEQVFTQAHWLIRYYLLFEDSNNIDFHNTIVNFYKTHSQFQTQNMSYDYFVRKYNSSIINSKGKSLQLKDCFLNVNQFYKKLLDNKIQIIKL